MLIVWYNLSFVYQSITELKTSNIDGGGNDSYMMYCPKAYKLNFLALSRWTSYLVLCVIF